MLNAILYIKMIFVIVFLSYLLVCELVKSKPTKWESIIFIYKVNDDFDHGVLFLGATFGNHQSEGDEGVVSDALSAILVVKNAVAIEEPQE